MAVLLAAPNNKFHHGIEKSSCYFRRLFSYLSVYLPYRSKFRLLYYHLVQYKISQMMLILHRKIKIKKVTDNTSKEVELEVQLAAGVSPEQMIDALYAFTDCEVSISPNTCIIIDEKPHFLRVNEILKLCTHRTVELLKQELAIKEKELQEKMLFSDQVKR